MAEKTFLLLTLVLFTLLPFHAVAVTTWTYGLSLPWPVNAWKEGVIVVLFALAMGRETQRDKAQKKRWDGLDYALLVYALIGILSTVWQFVQYGEASTARVFYGLKYDFLMLAVFVLFRHSTLVSDILLKKTLRAATFSGAVVLTFALLQLTVLPKDFLAHMGYSTTISAWSPTGAPAIYHGLDGAPHLMRVAGTFAGPNQFGTYCLILIGLFGSFLAGSILRTRKKMDERPLAKQKVHAACQVFFVALSVLGVVFSYSRSALLGMMVGGWGALALVGRHMGQQSVLVHWTKWKKTAGATALVLTVGVMLVSSLVPPQDWRSIVVRSRSSAEHYERGIAAVRMIAEKPLFGHGIGTAGPAASHAAREGQGPLPVESWHGQIGVEYGLPGLAAWLTILFCMGRMFLKKIKETPPTFTWRAFHVAFLFSFLAINTAGVFLHAWEDSAVALTWWGLAGMLLRKRNPASVSEEAPTHSA